LWTDELNRARADRAHPLHSFAAFPGDPASIAASGAKESGRVVVDYGEVESLTRLQDGFAFGLRPVRPGDLRLSRDPLAGLFDTAAARRDPAFRSLTLDREAERDHGRLGTWDRSGQTLRTPEFTIGSGRLWYLARGAGRAYAAVNAHLLIAGPLHGKLLTEWTDGGKGWRWVRHDLSAYRGHRGHVEFSPSGPGEMEIARVVDAEDEPGPVEGPEGVLNRVLSATLGDRTPEGLARAYQSLLTETARRMETDTLADSDHGAAFARLAEWVVRSPDLFATASADATRGAILAELERLRLAEGTYARQLSTGTTPAPAIVDGSGVDEHLLIRGSSRTPGAEVPRRFLEAIAGDSPLIDPSKTETGSGRLALARQMVGPSNPFAGRVIVNRVWHHLFGRGIVASVDNFGVLGEPPT
ncbi:MAG: DUF1553 domain-containing protein, partial [Planctomycetia bacterium]|nr:DUF1553 domain-containing protein [Planctomycetia bacterium]